MSSPIVLKSPPPREGRAEDQIFWSSRVSESPCVLCSPLARDEGVRSPLGGHVRATDDPVGLIVEAWCSPTLVSPAGRQCSVMQLQQHQAAGPVNISDSFLEEKQWDMEAMVLSTIAGKIEDEEEEEEEVRNADISNVLAPRSLIHVSSRINVVATTY